jgi:ATP-dependent DNA helicase RecG
LQENQNIEFKTIWKDEYLKHICAFSNANGGELWIGVNDHSEAIGTEQGEKLLEEIPNMAVQQLGVVVSVENRNIDDKNVVIIGIKQSPVPISYKGRYFVRSGSTVQELKGSQLNNYLLSKLGKTFDELPTANATMDDLDLNAIQFFIRKGIRNNRLSLDAEGENETLILKKLNLFSEENKLKNAALLLFGKDPLKFFGAVSFRIGRFGSSHHDLKFHDIIEGNLIEMPDKVMAMLKSKYLVMNIRYEGLQRIEELEYPEDALREAILNAIIHKDYTGVHIQLSVYDDKIILWNPGSLPAEINLDQLKDKHPSIPRNKIIADIFFKAGYIEAWGRGINKIISGFEEASLPQPLF